MPPDNGELRKTRIYSGLEAADNRTHFQRDRDRILYTPAFRRLAGVTQVVHVNTERGYHNRLTHSLKVAQVGRRLAEYFVGNTDDNIIEAAGGLNPDVVETACLAHDLGHPPFGHPAENALQEKLAVTDSFEGNPQSFRIVNNVAIHNQPYGSNHNGLDLTLASLNAILKYPWQRQTTGKKSDKWGYYSTEQDEFERVRELRTPGDSDESRSLEAELMDWADDLTYAIHDVADFYKAGLIPLDELIRGTSEREDFIEEFEDDYGSTPDRWSATEFLDKFLPDLATIAGPNGGNGDRSHHLDTPFKGSSNERAGISFMTSELVERYLGLDSDVDVTIDPNVRGGLDIDEVLKWEIDLLQYLSEYYVFNNSALLAQQQGHRTLVEQLFEILSKAAKDENDIRGILPTPFDEKVEHIHNNNLGYDDIDKDTLCARIVADIIASMTEPQAMDLYERVTGRSPGLVTDRIV